MTEFDMGAVREMFTKVLDTVAEATQLSRDVAELRETVNTFRKEIEDARATNRWLDSQITELRTQRDARAQEAAELATSLASTQHDLRELRDINTTISMTIASMRSTLDHTSRERDDALLQNMQLEEENVNLKKKLAHIIETLGGVAAFSVPSEPLSAPLPSVQATHPVQEVTDNPTGYGDWKSIG